MAKKSDRQELLKTGCQLVEKVGFKGLTARALAKEGNISTQPIYLVFNNMTELRDGVSDYLFSLIRTDYFQKNKGLSSFLQNYGRFIRKYPTLFLSLLRDQKDIRLQTEHFFVDLLKESLQQDDQETVGELESKLLFLRITGMMIGLVETNLLEERFEGMEMLIKNLTQHDLQSLEQFTEEQRERKR